MDSAKRPLRISVAGASQASPEELSLAEETGRLLGERGAIVICGGLGGVMEAACRGASSAGAVTVGILPGSDPDSANPHVLIPIPTGLGEVRNALVATSSDGSGIPVVGLGTWELDPARTKPFVLHRASTAAEAVELAYKLVK
jgi:uncharacterized protein (TIGR00725 family)